MTTHYSLDDVGQIKLLPLENLKSELIQADISFGYGLPTALTSKDIDNALKNQTSILDKKIMLSEVKLIADNLGIPHLTAVCDGQPVDEEVIGFSGLALIIETKSNTVNNFNLILKSTTDSEKSLMADLIVKLSNTFNLFLVDFALGSIVNTSQNDQLIKYLDFEN